MTKKPDITGYIKDERRQAIIKLLSKALGQDHQVVIDLTKCYSNHSSQTNYFNQKDRCEQHFLCDMCNMMRVRLMKGVFYLAYCKGMDDFHTVTITPKQPIESLDQCRYEFDRQESVCEQYWGSFIGSREIKSTISKDNYSLWPHMHLIAQRRGKKSRFEPFSETIDLVNIEKHIWHNHKPLPMSWFPRKKNNTHIVDLTYLDLTTKQVDDIRMLVDRTSYLKTNLRIGMGFFGGIFDFDIYRSELAHLYQNYEHERSLKGFKTVLERSDFTKVISFIYLVLCCDIKKKKAKRMIGIKNDSDRKALEGKIKAYEVKAYTTIVAAKFYQWKIPIGISERQATVLELALEKIELAAIYKVSPVGRTQVYNILSRFNINTREKRLCARASLKSERMEERLNGKS